VLKIKERKHQPRTAKPDRLGLRQPYRKAEAGLTGRAVTLPFFSPDLFASHPLRASQNRPEHQSVKQKHKKTRHAKRRTTVGLAQARRCNCKSIAVDYQLDDLRQKQTGGIPFIIPILDFCQCWTRAKSYSLRARAPTSLGAVNRM
jgi:hypothetical protein